MARSAGNFFSLKRMALIVALDGIPGAASANRLGNRSALAWVMDRYGVKTDRRSVSVNDPNRADS